jgi:hypothetical protein
VIGWLNARHRITVSSFKAFVSSGGFKAHDFVERRTALYLIFTSSKNVYSGFQTDFDKDGQLQD